MLAPEERDSFVELNRKARAKERVFDVAVLAVAGIVCIWIGFLAIGWIVR